MLDLKISQLPAATSVGQADLIEIVQSGANKKATGSLLSFWSKAATTLSPVTAGDNIAAGTGKFTAGSNTEISEVSGDTVIENTSATGNIFKKLGDALGITWAGAKDSAGIILMQVFSDGTIQLGKTGIDGVEQINDASNVAQVQLNTVGDSYFNGGNLGVGTKNPNATLALNGSLSKKRTDAEAADYNPSALTDDYMITADNTLAARAIIISTEDVQSGTTANPRFFKIKDEYLNATTFNLTITLENGGTIDGAANAVINGNNGSKGLYVDGTNGFII